MPGNSFKSNQSANDISWSLIIHLSLWCILTLIYSPPWLNLWIMTGTWEEETHTHKDREKQRTREREQESQSMRLSICICKYFCGSSLIVENHLYVAGTMLTNFSEHSVIIYQVAYWYDHVLSDYHYGC